MSHTDDPVTVLSSDACWEFLQSHEFGRLAFHLADEVHITPVNYAVAQPRLYFLTAEGSKLLGVVMNPDVAFEVDELGPDRAISVVVKGSARKLEEDEAHIAETLPLKPWVPTLKYDVVEVTVTSLTGRCFVLSRD